MNALLRRLGIPLPILQAPMAGISTPAMAAAVSNAGGLGAIGVGNLDATAARQMIDDIRDRSDRPFNVNLFCHTPAHPDPPREAAWIDRLSPHFRTYGANPPSQLKEIYRSFVEDDDMLAMLLETRPAVVSFHFGLPESDRIRRLKEAGILLLATATSLPEAEAVQDAGIDAVVAQGYEAGGHRGMFDPHVPDERYGVFSLTRLLVRTVSVPVIAAGGIMDGASIAASLALGASAAQLGTAFLLCPESAADAGYRAALQGDSARRTAMTSAISGRPARSLVNRFTELGDAVDRRQIPDYPIAYDLGKSLHAAAKAAGEFGYGAQWAGQAAPLCRALPAGELVTTLGAELAETLARSGSPASRP